MIMNWVAPPWNYPRGVKGSISPAYRGGTVYHYVAAMGYDDTPGARAVWIADSGFWPLRVLVRLRPGRDAHPAEGLHVRRRRPLTADQALDYTSSTGPPFRSTRHSEMFASPLPGDGLQALPDLECVDLLNEVAAVQ